MLPTVIWPSKDPDDGSCHPFPALAASETGGEARDHAGQGGVVVADQLRTRQAPCAGPVDQVPPEAAPGRTCAGAGYHHRSPLGKAHADRSAAAPLGSDPAVCSCRSQADIRLLTGHAAQSSHRDKASSDRRLLRAYTGEASHQTRLKQRFQPQPGDRSVHQRDQAIADEASDSYLRYGRQASVTNNDTARLLDLWRYLSAFRPDRIRCSGPQPSAASAAARIARMFAPYGAGLSTEPPLKTAEPATSTSAPTLATNGAVAVVIPPSISICT